MDPFSLSVGVASLLTLTAKTIRATRSYCQEAKHAKEAASELLTELDVLYFNLSQLDQLLKHDGSSSFSNTSVLTTSTHGCRNKLSVVHNRLEKAAAHPMHRFLWPLSSDEHHKTLQELRAFVQWIQFALTIDGSTLLAKTSTEVIDVLTNQLQMLQLLEQVDTRAELTLNTVVDIWESTRTFDAIRERDIILNWISSAKFSQKHNDVRQPRVEGTGEWLLDEPAFKNWRDGVQNVLWCYGIQGSGKSILASLVIDHLYQTRRHHNSVVVHVYFDYQEQENENLESTIASLLQQVVSALPKVPTVVTALYHKFGKQKHSPTLRDLVHALSLSCREYKVVYIIIDALDECESKCRAGLLSLLDDLKIYAKLFVTSRPYPDNIREAFNCGPQIEVKAHSPDLERYISEQIRGSDMSDEIDDTFRAEMVTKIVQSAQDMFLLAVLHVRTVFNESTIGDMEDALDCLPQDLHTAFQETMQRIKRQPDGRSTMALQALRLICRATRPMLQSELRDALAFRPRLTSVSRKYRPSREMVLDVCHGLVTIEKESQIMRLAHYSVHAFLVGSHEDILRDERLIAKLCIDYQMLQPFASGCCKNEDEISERILDCPFVSYAAQHWGSHVLAADDPTINDGALSFLRARPQLTSSYQIWQYTKGRREVYWTSDEAVSCNPLHMVAIFGLHRFATQLLPLYPIDEPTHMGTTALIKAAACGHQSLVSLFMDHNADPTKHNWYGTALHAAAEADMVSCIHELLDRDFDVDIEDHHGRSPLICAAQSGHAEAIHALLERGANVNFFYKDLGTPLFGIVLEFLAPKLVETLLEFGADPNIPSVHGSLPLHIVAEKNDDDVEVARILLDSGSDVNAQDRQGQTPLQTAATANNICHMRLFLDHHADIDAKSDDMGTALSSAVRHRNVDAVALLLERGANTEIADDLGVTPLNYAKHQKNDTLEQMLVEAGATRVMPNAESCIKKREALDQAQNGERILGDKYWTFEMEVLSRKWYSHIVDACHSTRKTNAYGRKAAKKGVVIARKLYSDRRG
ncbi:MAG: hypothetical protein Q9180_003033 [Flavoplaca navasiana]